MKWCDKPTGDGCVQEMWAGGAVSSDIAVSHTFSKCPYVQYADTRFRNISDQCH